MPSRRFPYAALVRLTLVLAGLAGLCATTIEFARHDAQMRLDHAGRLAGLAVGQAQGGVRDLLARFDRATAALRAQDVLGDPTALSSRLLRAEPLAAPAARLVVINPRGRQVAGTSPGITSPGGGTEDRWQAGVLSLFEHSPRGTALLPLAPAGGDGDPGYVLARRIDDGQRGLAGVVAAFVPAEAVRSASRPVPGLLPAAVAAAVASPGEARPGAAPAGGAPDLAGEPGLAGLLRPWLPVGWLPSRVARVEGTIEGLAVSATVDTSMLGATDGPGSPLGPLAGLGVAALALVAAPFAVRRRPAVDAGPAEAGELQALRTRLEDSEGKRDRVLEAIGHDVRTPISSIVGMSALLLDGSLDADQRRWVGLIRASCNALLAMLNGILEIAAARTGGGAVQNEPVDVATLAEEVGAVLRQQAHDKGIELDCHVGAGALGLWSTDPTRLRQVLFNLAGNAVKYTAAGSVRIEVSAIPGPDGADRLRLQVADTGPGIPEDERERVFERFSRGSGAGSGQAGSGQAGLGLGLAICREIAALMGAELTLASAVGAGSIFTFDVPAARVGPAGGAALMTGRTALVVGLSDGVRSRTAAHLEQLGFAVETAADGFVGIGMAERTVFRHDCLDLAVVDGALPGLPADALIDRLQRGPGGHRVRIVVVTNEAGPVGAGQGYAGGCAGADALLPHPVEAQAIEGVVARLFGATTVLQEVDPRAGPAPCLRVLVVEDNRINQALFLDLLNRAGFSAHAASAGAEAVAAAGRGGFDVILMDVQMPGMDGIEATRLIRGAEGPRRVPVVGLTAHTGAEVRRRCLEAGMDLVLHKPADLARLPLRLRSAVAAARVLPPDAGAVQAAALDIADEHLAFLVAQVGEDRARSCVVDFLAQAAAQLRAAPSLLADHAALGRMAHDLAGVSGTLGVTGLLDGLLAVEDAARDGDAAGIERALDEVCKTWERVQPVLHSRFEAVAAGRAGPERRVA